MVDTLSIFILVAWFDFFEFWCLYISTNSTWLPLKIKCSCANVLLRAWQKGANRTKTPDRSTTACFYRPGQCRGFAGLCLQHYTEAVQFVMVLATEIMFELCQFLCDPSRFAPLPAQSGMALCCFAAAPSFEVILANRTEEHRCREWRRCSRRYLFLSDICAKWVQSDRK